MENYDRLGFPRTDIFLDDLRNDKSSISELLIGIDSCSEDPSLCEILVGSAAQLLATHHLGFRRPGVMQEIVDHGVSVARTLFLTDWPDPEYWNWQEDDWQQPLRAGLILAIVNDDFSTALELSKWASDSLSLARDISFREFDEGENAVLLLLCYWFSDRTSRNKAEFEAIAAKSRRGSKKWLECLKAIESDDSERFANALRDGLDQYFKIGLKDEYLSDWICEIGTLFHGLASLKGIAVPELSAVHSALVVTSETISG